MKTASKKAYAKINLFLEVNERREDGYHNLTSVMQTVSLADTVTVTRDESDRTGKITVSADDARVPTDDSNIVVRCARRFFEAFPAVRTNIHITIAKQIPMQGGLGGGSADGAATLRLLDSLCGTHATDDELVRIGASVGADVPFCLRGGTVLCGGIGEEMTPLAPMDGQIPIVLAFPLASEVSTPEAYRWIDALGAREYRRADELISALCTGAAPRVLYNRFEEVILPRRPNAATVRQRMQSLGAESVLMSGSGPSVYGIFPNDTAAQAACRTLSAENISSLLVYPVKAY